MEMTFSFSDSEMQSTENMTRSNRSSIHRRNVRFLDLRSNSRSTVLLRSVWQKSRVYFVDVRFDERQFLAECKYLEFFRRDRSTISRHWSRFNGALSCTTFNMQNILRAPHYSRIHRARYTRLSLFSLREESGLQSTVQFASFISYRTWARASPGRPCTLAHARPIQHFD